MKNKGFTLIELIVAMAIGSIVLLMVSIMLVRGTNIFRTENNEVNMRNDYQIVRNQIDQVIMEAKILIIEDQGEDLLIYTGEIDSITREFTTPVDDRTTERIITYDKSEKCIYISGTYADHKAEGNRICNIVEKFSISLNDSAKREEYDDAGTKTVYYVNPIRVDVILDLAEKKSDMNSSFAVNLRNRLKAIRRYKTTDPAQVLNAETIVEEYKVK